MPERSNRVKPKSRSTVSRTSAAVGIKRKASPIKDKNLSQPEKYIKLQLKHETGPDRNVDSRKLKDSLNEVKVGKKSVCSVDQSSRVPKESRTDKTQINQKRNRCVA